MMRQRLLPCCCIAALMSGCSVSGEDAAHQWISAQASEEKPVLAGALPPIIQTPAATYAAKEVMDPFMPERITKVSVRNSARQGELPGRAHFAETTVDSLRVVGFLEVHGQYVCVLEGPTGYGNARVGDRLGTQQAEIVAISAKGARLRQADGSEFWMPITKRSH